jgi:hypothetical protein
MPMKPESTGSKPWYREPWPWLLMAGPAVVIVAGFATLYLAVTTGDGLVVDDYYKQGLAINATLAREERARALGLSAALEFSSQHDGVQLRLVGAAIRPARLQLRFVHRTRGGQDQVLILLAVPDQGYFARMRPLQQGAWQVVVEDDVGGWRLAGTLLPWQERLELRPG